MINKGGLFDPRYFLYYEEVDHCHAAKQAGWKVIFFGGTDVIHLGGVSASAAGNLTTSGKQIPALQIESELLYFRQLFGLTGALASLLLSSLAHSLVKLKTFLRRRRAKTVTDSSNQFAALWQLAVRTRLGARPTR